jgi:hypothetical protein
MMAANSAGIGGGNTAPTGAPTPGANAPSPTPLTPAEATVRKMATARLDLKAITELAAIVHPLAWWPRAHDPAQPRARTTPTSGATPQPGDPRAAEGYVEAVRALKRAATELHLAFGLPEILPLPADDPAPRPVHIDYTCRVLANRMEIASVALEGAELPPQRARHAATATGHVTHAYRELRRARGRKPIKPKPCRTCNGFAGRGNGGAQGECAACYKYRRRKGEARPKRLWG